MSNLNEREAWTHPRMFKIELWSYSLDCPIIGNSFCVSDCCICHRGGNTIYLRAHSNGKPPLCSSFYDVAGLNYWLEMGRHRQHVNLAWLRL